MRRAPPTYVQRLQGHLHLLQEIEQTLSAAEVANREAIYLSDRILQAIDARTDHAELDYQQAQAMRKRESLLAELHRLEAKRRVVVEELHQAQARATAKKLRKVRRHYVT